MKKISLIIPVYNAEKYLPQMAESLLSQDWDNVQFIFSEDSSTDNSLKMLRALEKKDDRVVVITGENHGVSAARNRALRLADGDYIGFADSDDLLEPGYLRTLAELLEAHQADVACCGFSRIYEASGKQDRMPPKESGIRETEGEGFYKMLLRNDGFTLVLWNKLFRREALLTENGQLQCFDESLHIVEDGEFIFRARIHKAVFTGEALYRYFVRTSGALYGAITPRKLTEPKARRMIVEHCANCSEEIQNLARMRYQKGIRDLMFRGVITGEYAKVKHLMPELKTYRKELYASPALSKKEKLKYRIYRPLIQMNLRHVGAFLMEKLSGH